MSLKCCTYGLEDAKRCTIYYVLWLQKNDLQFFPNAILISAVREQWKPKA